MAWSSLPFVVLFALAVSAQLGASDLAPDYYRDTCPNLETIVRGVVKQKMDANIRAIGSTIRLFFHDCFVEGCDGSVLISSTAGSAAERDADDNKSLAFEGFDTVNAAKAAVEAACPDQVSCADILTIATRDAISMSGAPFYPVELGRLDGLSSSASSVAGQLPRPTHTINQLIAIFRAHGLTTSHMVALSAAHTVGLAHCGTFRDRVYGNPADPTLNPTYAAFLRTKCPADGSSDPMVLMDQSSPATFDNQYFRNLQDGGGLLASDQVLYTDSRTRTNVNALANSTAAFNSAFVDAITKLGRVGVKSGSQGNIRQQCDVFN
ncbi:peroxidase 51 [Lolium perenne]|uniref:peroxidase 51 n=1 Tax=Lolium perenne TaxID=4522 RepID=UPI0021F6695D|nr:peroxidase 51-like [Lolium perenne]